ncbi:MAG TPA: phage portal protein [Acidimicrobiia bacterium]
MLGNLFERRSSAFQNLWAAGALTDRPSLTGVRVTEETSLRLSAVYASVRLVADTIATLPLDQFIRVDGQRTPFRPRDPWVGRPSLTMPRTTFWQQAMMSLLLDGNAFVHLGRDGAGRIVDLQVLNPTHVHILDGRRGYQVDGHGTLPVGEVLHVTEMLLPGKERGTSRIEQAKESLGLGIALQEYASTFFGNGAFPGVVLEIPGEPTLEQRQEIQATWENQHRGTRKAHKPAILMNGAKATPMTANPAETQLLEQRRYAVEEVARLFRVPPFMLGVTTPGSVSYASVEQQMLFYAEHTVRPYAEMLEAAFSQLLVNEDSFIKFNLNALVRADLTTRTDAYSKALLAGYMSVNEVRALEDMRDVDSGGLHRVPLQNIPVEDSPIITAQQKATAAQQLVTAGYTPESVAEYLGIPVDHTGLPSVQLQPEQNGGDDAA